MEKKQLGTVKITKNMVQFGMFWQEYGQQSIELPDTVNPENRDEVIAYIKSVWDDIPLPYAMSSDYVMGSDELDEESDIHVYPKEEDVSCMEKEDGFLKAEWENADEGLCGDYNPEDPDDVNLLRFYISMKVGGRYQEVEDASYCTQMPADTKPEILLKGLELLLREYSVLKSDPHISVKKIGEALSYMSPDWFEKKITKEALENGFSKGVVQLIEDPQNQFDPGTVCKIGDYWFYFSDLLACDKKPAELLKEEPLETIIQEIYETLEGFREDGPEFRDEHDYYYHVLKEAGCCRLDG